MSSTPQAEILAAINKQVNVNGKALDNLTETVTDTSKKTINSMNKVATHVSALIDVLKKNPQLITNATGQITALFSDVKAGVAALSKTINMSTNAAEKQVTARASATSAQKSIDSTKSAQFSKTVTMVASDLPRFVEIAMEYGYTEASEFDLKETSKHSEYAKKICAFSDDLSAELSAIRAAYNQEIADKRIDKHSEESLHEEAPKPKEPKTRKTKTKTTRTRKKAAPEPVITTPVEDPPADDEEKKDDSHAPKAKASKKAAKKKSRR